MRLRGAVDRACQLAEVSYRAHKNVSSLFMRRFLRRYMCGPEGKAIVLTVVFIFCGEIAWAAAL